MNLTVRVAIPEDATLISEIGKETFYETWRPVNTEEDMKEYMKNSFALDKIKSEITNKVVNTFLIASDGDHIIGYTKLRRDRWYAELEGKKSLEIERIYVKKSYQDKKAGKAMMDESIRIAENEACCYLWLGVNVDNTKAIRFYEKYNFVIFGEKKFQLGAAVDTDYLMKKNISD